MGLRGAELEMAAATRLGAKLGLGSVQPQIIKLAKHTTLRLNPLPIVARVQSSASADLPYGSADDELLIATHLQSRGAPAVRPALRAPPGPHVEDGWVITLWEWLAGHPVRKAADGLEAVAALKAIHRALDEVAIELPSFTGTIDSCDATLSDSSAAQCLQPGDRLFLHKLYAKLREHLDDRRLLYRPLHGDAHFGNVLITSDGAIWLDLEAVCSGPLEWDVVTLPSRYWSEFESLDADVANLLSNLRSVCVSVWSWAAFDRSSETRQAAIYHLDTLKARFG